MATNQVIFAGAHLLMNTGPELTMHSTGIIIALISSRLFCLMRGLSESLLRLIFNPLFQIPVLAGTSLTARWLASPTM